MGSEGASYVLFFIIPCVASPGVVHISVQFILVFLFVMLIGFSPAYRTSKHCSCLLLILLVSFLALIRGPSNQSPPNTLHNQRKKSPSLVLHTLNSHRKVTELHYRSSFPTAILAVSNTPFPPHYDRKKGKSQSRVELGKKKFFRALGWEILSGSFSSPAVVP